MRRLGRRLLTSRTSPAAITSGATPTSKPVVIAVTASVIEP
jgi:hypothetical protein